MARLRNIDGVTRVSLSKSDKEATTAGRRRRREGPQRDGLLRRANDIPAFELIVFFEGAAAAATAPTPGAAAAAPATTTSTRRHGDPGRRSRPRAPATPAAGATPAPAGTAPAATPAPATSQPASTTP